MSEFPVFFKCINSDNFSLNQMSSGYFLHKFKRAALLPFDFYFLRTKLFSSFSNILSPRIDSKTLKYFNDSLRSFLIRDELKSIKVVKKSFFKYFLSILEFFLCYLNSLSEVHQQYCPSSCLPILDIFHFFLYESF